MVEIKNFVKNQVLEVSTLDCAPAYPATVTLMQGTGSMRFLFAMLPAQARELAAALSMCAMELDCAAKELAGELEGAAKELGDA
jgi:hypothetical protein